MMRHLPGIRGLLIGFSAFVCGYMLGVMLFSQPFIVKG
jgi:hypothetical protein